MHPQTVWQLTVFYCAKRCVYLSFFTLNYLLKQEQNIFNLPLSTKSKMCLLLMNLFRVSFENSLHLHFWKRECSFNFFNLKLTLSLWGDCWKTKVKYFRFWANTCFIILHLKTNFFWQMNERRASGQKAPRQLSLEINSKGIVFAILFKFNPRSKNEFVRLKNWTMFFLDILGRIWFNFYLINYEWTVECCFLSFYK